MALLHSFNPSADYSLAQGTEYLNQIIEYYSSDNGSGYEQVVVQSLAFVASESIVAPVLSDNATLFPGVTIDGPSLANAVGGVATVKWKGTPTASGTYYFYLRGRSRYYVDGAWTTESFVKKYTVSVSGMSLTISPDGGAIKTVDNSSPIQGVAFISAPFTISNGSGSYQVEITGPWTGSESGPAYIGLNSDAIVPGTLYRTININTNTFYVVSPVPVDMTAGSYTLNIIVTDQANSQTTSFIDYTFTVQEAAGGTLSISVSPAIPVTLSSISTGTYVFSATGGSGTYQWSHAGITPGGTIPGVPGGPAGGAVFQQVGQTYVLTLNKPLEKGIFNLGIGVTDGTSSGTKSITLNIDPESEVVGTFPSGTEGVLYQGNLYLIGSRPLSGTYSYNWTLSSGSLPPGLTIGPGAKINTISGTPTSAGTFNFTIACTWNLAEDPLTYETAYKAFTIIIGTGAGGGSLTVSSQTVPTFTQNSVISPITFTASGTGMTLPLIWSTVSGTLPEGLLLTQDGNNYVLSGTPSSYTPSTPPTISLQVVDSSAIPKTGGRNITLTVNPNFSISGAGFPDGVVGQNYSTIIPIVGGDPPEEGDFGAYYPTIELVSTTSGLPGISYQALSYSDTANGIQGFGVLSQPGTFNTTFRISQALSGRNGQIYTQDLTDSVTVTGSSITITPYNTTVCASITNTEFRASAKVLGGIGNQYKVIFSGLDSVTTSLPSMGGGYYGPISSNEEFIFTAGYGASPSPVTFILTYVSMDDDAITATTTYTVDDTARVFNWSPAKNSNHTLYGGQSLPISVSMNNGCHQTLGKWSITPSVGTLSPSAYGGGVTYLAPSTINTLTNVTVRFNSFVGLADTPSGELEGAYNIVLLPGLPGVSITTSSPLPIGTVNSAYTPITFGYTGVTGTPSWTVIGSLPAGLSLNPSSGVLEGTPTAHGTYSFNIRVQVTPSSGGSVQEATKAFTLTINAVSGTEPTITSITPSNGPRSGGTSVTIVGTNFQAGDVVRFYSQSMVGSADCTMGAITATSISLTTPIWNFTGDIVDVAIIRSGSILVNKTSGFTYSNVSGSLVITGFLQRDVNAGYNSDIVLNISGEGFTSTCVVKYKPYNVGSYINLSTTYVSPTSITAVLPKAYFTEEYAGTSGLIQIFRSSDNVTANAPYEFLIKPVSLIITTNLLTEAVRGEVYNQALSVSGGVGPYTWSLPLTSAPLPSGLSLNSSGVIYGTVASDAQSSIPTFKVEDSGSPKQTTTKALSLIVGGGILSISTETVPEATIGTFYNVTLSGSGGASPYTWLGPISGALPSGLTISSSGVISGTPSGTANSTYTFTVRLTDNVATSVTKQFSIYLNPARSVVTVDSLVPDFGPTTGGTSVTIQGTGFENGCTVKFGTAAATSVSYISPTRLTCITPPTAESIVSVTVTNPDLGFGTKTNAFSYRPLVAPIVSGIDIQDGPFEGGQVVTLYGSNFTGVTSVSFGLENTPASSFNATGLSLDLSATPQKITLTTPAYILTDKSVAVPINIYVTNAQGTGTLAAGDIGYVYRPAPIITQIIPSSGSTKGGNTIYIIGKNFFERGNKKPRVFIGNVEVPPNDVVLKEE